MTASKPRFRFGRRSAGTYYWEPLNDAARALPMVGESTGVSWFWGDARTGLGVTLNAHTRAGELGMKPAEYREHVRRLTTEARAAAGYRPLTSGELAELIPPGSWPRGMASLPAPVPAADVAAWYGDPSDWKPSKSSRFRRMFSRKARS